jgi:hypothetical protein
MKNLRKVAKTAKAKEKNWNKDNCTYFSETTKQHVMPQPADEQEHKFETPIIQQKCTGRGGISTRPCSGGKDDDI